MKKEYLIKTLSRTKRKDYENYVVNRLYSQLDDLTIKPMTQKYVKRTLNGTSGYALIDLYFPQFNIGIEIDEAHHISQEDLDRLRTEDIVGSLDGYEERRIIVSDKTILEINDAITKEVEYIKLKKQKQIENGIFKNWEEIPARTYFKSKEKITIYDDIEFGTIIEASNIIFATEYKGMMSGFFRIPTIIDKKVMAWFPQLAVEKDGELFSAAGDFLNTLNDEKDAIIEYDLKGKLINDNIDMSERVTFMKIKNKITDKINYKFLGVFYLEDIDGNKRTYKRKLTEFNIIKASRPYNAHTKNVTSSYEKKVNNNVVLNNINDFNKIYPNGIIVNYDKRVTYRSSTGNLEKFADLVNYPYIQRYQKGVNPRTDLFMIKNNILYKLNRLENSNPDSNYIVKKVNKTITKDFYDDNEFDKPAIDPVNVFPEQFLKMITNDNIN